MQYSIYFGDTFTTLTGDNLTSAQWQEFIAASSPDRRKPASYAVHQAIEAATQRAFFLAHEQGLEMAAYTTNPQITDDGGIAAAVQCIREAVEARKAKLGGASVNQYACADGRNGCPTKVAVKGAYCDRCAHDAQ